MLDTIITKIGTTLAKVDELADIVAHPLGENEALDGYPGIVFFPDSIDNKFESSVENLRAYAFSLYVITEANIKSIGDATTIIAKAVDGVMDQFDEDWDAGNIDGHRMWMIINSGTWQYTLSESGATIVVPLNLLIKVAKDN